MVKERIDSDRVFKALADAKRRRMLDLLAVKARTTGEMVKVFGGAGKAGLSRFAVMKHLRVLQQAGLLVVSRDGRERWNSLNRLPLQEALGRWMGQQEACWAESMLRLRRVAESSEDGMGPKTDGANSEEETV